MVAAASMEGTERKSEGGEAVDEDKAASPETFCSGDVRLGCCAALALEPVAVRRIS